MNIYIHTQTNKKGHSLLKIVFLYALLLTSFLPLPAFAEPFLYPTRPLELSAGTPPATPLLKDGTQSLNLSHLRGKVVLLNFWATWCGPCVIEMPDLNKIQQKYKLGGLEVVAVSLDQEKSFSQIKSFYDEHNLNHLSVYTPRAPLAAAYGVRTLPSSVLIGRDGNIIGHVKGFTNWQDPQVERYIQEALRKGYN